MIVGFTGTQEGMTQQQQNVVRGQLNLLGMDQGERVFHHGDCVGADAEAHEIAVEEGYDLTIHPPKNPSKRAFCEGGEVLEPKDYIPRNHDIVDASSVMLAAPKRMTEELRSGTWATVRYAAKKRVKTIIIYPDGSIEIRG